MNKINNIEDFIKTNSFNYLMSNSKGLDSFDNYSGDGSDNVIVPGISRNRDSEILDESNFEAALEMLGGESDDVQINRYGHWACGWFEVIQVNPKRIDLIKKCIEIKELLDKYPVLDDSDYFERENEYQQNYAEECAEDIQDGLEAHFGIEKSELSRRFAIELNMECQRYYGNDSCINLNEFKEPDAYDIEKIVNCCKQLADCNFNDEMTALIKYTMEVASIYLEEK